MSTIRNQHCNLSKTQKIPKVIFHIKPIASYVMRSKKYRLIEFVKAHLFLQFSNPINIFKILYAHIFNFVLFPTFFLPEVIERWTILLRVFESAESLSM